jgi:transcriptional antiterminator RfaH
MGLEWFVLRLQPRSEYLAAGELARDGFQIFFPCVKAPTLRVGHADEPLFPGYLFLRYDPASDGWPSFRPAHRVTGWVSFEGFTPSIPDDVVEELVRRVDELNAANGLWRRYLPGEKVEVKSGNLQGLAEVVEGAKSPEGRARVLLQFMGRLVPMLVPWENLYPVQNLHHPRPQAPRRTRGRGRWLRDYRPQPVAGT